MQLRRLDHYNIDTAKPEETIAFYCDVLGCVDDPTRRPDFDFPGAWLLVDDHPAIHLNFVPDDRAGPTGAFNHVAFEASGFDDFCLRLDERGIPYRVNDASRIGLRQIFVKDPNQVRVELNFRAE